MSRDVPALLVGIEEEDWASLLMDWVEATKPTAEADAMQYTFATNVCVSVGTKPKNNGNNVRFKLWSNGTPKVAKERGMAFVNAIDKEYDCDIARVLLLWWATGHAATHADDTHAEWLVAVNNFIKKDTFYFTDALNRRRQAQSVGHSNVHDMLYTPVLSDLRTKPFHLPRRGLNLLPEASLNAMLKLVQQCLPNDQRGGQCGSSKLFRSTKLWWDKDWKKLAAHAVRDGHARTNYQVTGVMLHAFKSIVRSVKTYAGWGEDVHLNDADAMVQWRGCKGTKWHMDCNYPSIGKFLLSSCSYKCMCPQVL